MTGRRQEVLAKGARSLPAGAAVTCAGDVTKFEDANRMVETALGLAGRLDVLVNNAGVAPKERRDLLEASEKSFEGVMRINLQGPYFLTQDASAPTPAPGSPRTKRARIEHEGLSRDQHMSRFVPFVCRGVAFPQG